MERSVTVLDSHLVATTCAIRTAFLVGEAELVGRAVS